jgi:hypothetical protein
MEGYTQQGVGGYVAIAPSLITDVRRRELWWKQKSLPIGDCVHLGRLFASCLGRATWGCSLLVTCAPDDQTAPIHSCYLVSLCDRSNLLHLRGPTAHGERHAEATGRRTGTTEPRIVEQSDSEYWH